MDGMKVIHVSAGEGHSLLLTEDGCVYAWGKGMFGRLGTGKDSDELLPIKIPITRNLEHHNPEEDQLGSDEYNNYYEQHAKIVGVAAGAYHNLALSDDGFIWSWGYNVYGQLGRGDELSFTPCFVEEFVPWSTAISENTNRDNGRRVLKAIDVKAGGMMSLAIDQYGTLWIWGRCPHPSSKNNDKTFSLSFIPSPKPVKGFQGYSVSKVACGNEHVLALVNHGATVAEGHLICYTWGNNTHGQLGLGDKEGRLVPEPLKCFNKPSSGIPFYIACGAFHTAVLTSVNQNDIYMKGQGTICWTFGLNENGQLGLGTTDIKLLPEPVDGLPKSALFKLVECGLFHTCVLSDSGDVWIWGMERGLGLCPNIGPPGVGAGDALYPLKISDGSLFSGSVEIGCGAAHTVVVADNGFKLWAWGRGQNGVLGTGDTLDSLVPCPVSWPPPLSDLDQKGLKNEGEKDMIVGKVTKAEDRTNLDEDAYLSKFRLIELSNKLSFVEEEVQFLKAELATVQGYADILHFSIFGNHEPSHSIKQMVHRSNHDDILEEWVKAMDLASDSELVQMETFYRTMRSKVKDIIMQRKIKEWTRQCLDSFS